MADPVQVIRAWRGQPRLNLAKLLYNHGRRSVAL